MTLPKGTMPDGPRPAQRLADLGASPIRALGRGAPPDAIPLGLGEPTWPLPEPARQALAEASEVCSYGPNAGLPELRQAIAVHHGASPEEVLVTTGCEGALASLFQAWLDPGDTVLVPNPGFPAYPALARLAGATPKAYPLDQEAGFALDPTALIRTLEQTPNVKVVILNHPSNPTGGGADHQALTAVSQACEERGILLISDEVYRELYLGDRPLSLRDVSAYGVVVSSVSKGWGAPGLRVGWAVGDPSWLEPAHTVHAYTVTAASRVAQDAARALIESSETVLAEARSKLSRRWDALRESILTFWHIDPPRRPTGGFYAWLPLPEAAAGDPMAFCLRLRDQAGVVVVPGTAFGEGGRGFVRLSFAAQPEQIREGVRRLAPYWRTGSSTSQPHRLWAFSDAELTDLAKPRPTPFFAYRGQVALASLAALRQSMPPRIRIAYAVKANSHPSLLRLFAGEDASFDCASEGELLEVSKVVSSPGRIFFAGPGKRTAELRLALKLGARVQAESWEDLERLENLKREENVEGPPLDVNLRGHPLAGVEEAESIIGGVGPAAFGVDEEELPDLLTRAATLKRVRIRGLHVFAASNQTDAQALLKTYAMVFTIARRLHQKHGLRLDQVDLGGGLGVPYADGDPRLDIGTLGAGLERLLGENPWFDGEVILEPGRFLAAACGVYVARVLRIKQSRGTRFAILDGGINHLLRPLLTGQPFPVRVLGDEEPKQPRLATVLAGPLCTGLDRVGEVELPARLAPGDLLAFGMTGAYGRSEGMTHFLSHPVPAEIVVP